MAAITSPRGLTIGQLARQTGVNLETIRYYERIGVMPRPDRTRAGHRTYGSNHVGRLTFVRRARELGFGLEDVRTLLTLASSHQTSCAEVKEIATAHLRKVRAKVADLRRLERILAETVRRCRGNASPDCPVLDMLRPSGGGAT
jgi:MerR family transcriptional regulator, mercuric resistance operon regulatory protein